MGSGIGLGIAIYKQLKNAKSNKNMSRTWVRGWKENESLKCFCLPKRRTSIFIEGKMFQNLGVSSPATVTVVCKHERCAYHYIPYSLGCKCFNYYVYINDRRITSIFVGRSMFLDRGLFNSNWFNINILAKKGLNNWQYCNICMRIPRKKNTYAWG